MGAWWRPSAAVRSRSDRAVGSANSAWEIGSPATAPALQQHQADGQRGGPHSAQRERQGRGHRYCCCCAARARTRARSLCSRLIELSKLAEFCSP